MTHNELCSIIDNHPTKVADYLLDKEDFEEFFFSKLEEEATLSLEKKVEEGKLAESQLNIKETDGIKIVDQLQRL